jgi:hypothetical protein
MAYSSYPKDATSMSPKRPTSPLKDTLTREMAVKRNAPRGYVLGVHGEAMLTAFPAFEAAGSYGNGPAWAALAEYLLSINPAITGVTFDDEGDAFVAYAEEEAALQELRARLIEIVTDDSKLRKAIAEARARGFGHGDL